jgi:outer membrane protein assembly factor BamB
MKTLPFFPASARAPRTLVAAAAFALAAGPACAASSWLQYGRDGRQANDNPQETTLTPANVGALAAVWGGRQARVPLDLPAARAGRIFGMTGAGLAAESATTGAARWRDADGVSTSTPALARDGRTILVAYPDMDTLWGIVAAVDPATGATRWSRGLDYFYHSPNWRGFVTVDGNVGVVATQTGGGGGGGWTFAFDVDTGGNDRGGSVIEYTNRIDPHVAVQGHWYYVVQTDTRYVNQLNAHERNKRSKRGWSAQLGSRTDGTAFGPRIAGTALLVSDSAGGVYALELATGAARWTTVLPTAAGTTPGVTAATDTRAFGVSHPVAAAADAINAIDVANGAVLWTAPLPGSARVHSNLAVANGMVFAGVGDAGSCTALAVLDAATGAVLASLPSGMPGDSGDACDLAVADGQVILHGRNAAGPTMQVLGLAE